MTTLREAATQALEAMRRAVPTGEITLMDWMKANRDLEAALAEHDKNLAWFKERKANWDLQRKLAEETQERDRQQREEALQRFTDVNQELEAALAEPVLTTCNCRWDGEVQVQQCTLHEAHVDAIKEWAQRAKFAEKKLAALAEPVQEPVANSDEVICPACCHQFRAIPVSVQTLMLDAGFEPPFTAPPQRKPLTEEEIAVMRTSIPKTVPFLEALVLYTRAVERKHGIGGKDE